MDMYDELAWAIVDYEEVGYYDLIDAYDTVENAFERISSDLRSGMIDLGDLYEEFSQTILCEDLSEEAFELANRVLQLVSDWQ